MKNGATTRRDVVATLLRHELVMLLRDRRTVLIALVAPLVLFPLFILVMRAASGGNGTGGPASTWVYAVTGARSAWAREQLGAALGDGASGSAAFREIQVDGDPRTYLARGSVDVVVEALTAPQARAAIREAVEDREAMGMEVDSAQVQRWESSAPVLRLVYRADSDASRAAQGELRERLRASRNLQRDSLLVAGGLPPTDSVMPVRVQDVAGDTRRGGALLGRLLLPFLVFLMVSGGSLVAADTVSGEKERGTLETLLTTSARRVEIVQAKQLAVIIVGMTVGVVNVLNLLLYIVLGVVDLPPALRISLGVPDLLALLLLTLPVAILVASVLLILSAVSGTYREYQLYFFPTLLGFVAVAFVPSLPGIDLRSVAAFVPIVGVGAGVREILLGEHDWAFLGLAFVSTMIAAWAGERLTERTLSKERLVGGVEVDEADLKGGSALFPRHVLRGFGLVWVVFFLASSWTADRLGLRGQILLGVVAIIFGGAVWMVRHYRLPLRSAFALRRPHPTAWLAVLVGAPSAWILGIGLASFVNRFVFPLPEGVVEAFGEYVAPAGMPFWELLLFAAVVPAVFEELAFRGVLLHGLRRRMGPVPAALLTGLVFGLFHLALFRIVPTAYVGVLLAGVVLVTGSIFPAMAWHAANNAIALTAARAGWVVEPEALPLTVYLAALVGLGAAGMLLWVGRRPGWTLRRASVPAT